MLAYVPPNAGLGVPFNRHSDYVAVTPMQKAAAAPRRGACTPDQRRNEGHTAMGTSRIAD